jgi:hypothetical protein
MKQITFEIRGGKIINPAEMRELFNTLKEGRHQLTIKDMRKRSLPQNDYYWGVVVPMCRQGLYDAGYDEVKTSLDSHEVLKHLFLKKEVVNKSTGEVLVLDGSSKELTIPEFNEYIENICKWAAEYLSIAIPSPNEAMATFADYIDEITER